MSARKQPPSGNGYVTWRELVGRFDAFDSRLRRVEIGMVAIGIAVAAPKLGAPSLPEAVQGLLSLL